MIPYFHVTEHFFFFSYKVGSEESCRRDEEFPGWETEGGGILRKKMGGGVGRKEGLLTFFRTEKEGNYNEFISTDLLGKSWLEKTTFICELDFEKNYISQ